MSKLLDAIKNKRQAIAAKSGREKPLKLSAAKNLVRILPRWDGNEEGAFYQDFGQHFIKDKAGKIQAVYICTATTFGKDCDVCGEIARLSALSNDPDMVEVFKEARSSSRVLVNAIYLNGSHANAKTDPVLLELPVTVLNDILGIMEEYIEGHGLNPISLKEGYDLVISKSGAGRDTTYTVVPSPKPRELANPQDVLSKCKNLEEYSNQEYAAGLTKAIASLGAVSGLSGPTSASSQARLVGPSSSTAAPAQSQAQQLANTAPVDTDDLDALMGELNDATDTTAAQTVVQTSKPVQAAVAAAAPTMDDELADLDAMLQGL